MWKQVAMQHIQILPLPNVQSYSWKIKSQHSVPHNLEAFKFLKIEFKIELKGSKM